MIHFALIALLQAQAAPHRDVTPGVIATGQRVSPAGVQSAFDGKVAGVRFGKTSDELWVAAPNITYRLDWRANTATARARLNGTPGVYGVTVDRVTNRVFVSSVGRLPAPSATPSSS